MAIKRPPGPKAGFFFGELRSFNDDSLAYLETLTADYGDFAAARFGPFWLYFINTPELIREVFVTKASAFHKTLNTKRSLQGINHPNLFSGDGDYWKRARKLAQPAFHTKRINNYADIMVQFTERMVRNWDGKDTLEIDREMANVTMNVVVKTLFDVDLHDETSDLQQAMLNMFSIIDHRIQRVIQIPGWLPTKENQTLADANEVMQRRIGGIIEDRRTSGEDKGDLLSMLLLSQDEENGDGLNNTEVYNEVLALFAAGHETTAGTLTWAWYLLSQHPEYAEALHEEVDRVLGGKPATLENLKELTLTEQIIKETLRLYPAAWAISRQAVEETEIGEYPVQKGTIMVASPWTIHRHPDYWENPDEFRPERFNAENEPNIPRYAYFPFGGGPRICIGNAFAMMEAQLILATVAQHYSLKLDPAQVVEPERRFTLIPKYGMKMLLEKRETVLEPV